MQTTHDSQRDEEVIKMLWIMRDDKIKNIIKAVIFDMDGVVSDTQKLCASIEKEMLEKYGIEISTEEVTRRYAGVSDKDFFRMASNDFGKKIPNVDQAVEEMWERIMKSAKGNISSIPGAKELISQLKNRQFLLGIASSSIIPFIELVLSELGLKDRFDTIVSAEEVERGKPDPAIFLLVAKKLKVRPEECVVIEDGINGMIAARRAGMKCIGLVPKKDQEIYPADILVKDLFEISIENL